LLIEDFIIHDINDDGDDESTAENDDDSVCNE
jgi:hypothetical protein